MDLQNQNEGFQFNYNDLFSLFKPSSNNRNHNRFVNLLPSFSDSYSSSSDSSLNQTNRNVVTSTPQVPSKVKLVTPQVKTPATRSQCQQKPCNDSAASFKAPTSNRKLKTITNVIPQNNQSFKRKPEVDSSIKSSAKKKKIKAADNVSVEQPRRCWTSIQQETSSEPLIEGLNVQDAHSFNKSISHANAIVPLSSSKEKINTFFEPNMVVPQPLSTPRQSFIQPQSCGTLSMNARNSFCFLPSSVPAMAFDDSPYNSPCTPNVVRNIDKECTIYMMSRTRIDTTTIPRESTLNVNQYVETARKVSMHTFGDVIYNNPAESLYSTNFIIATVPELTDILANKSNLESTVDFEDVGQKADKLIEAIDQVNDVEKVDFLDGKENGQDKLENEQENIESEAELNDYADPENEDEDDKEAESEVEDGEEGESEAEYDQEVESEVEDYKESESEAEDDNKEIESEVEDDKEIESETEDHKEIESDAEDDKEMESETEDDKEIESDAEDEDDKEIESDMEDDKEIESDMEDDKEIESDMEDDKEIESEMENDQESEHEEAESEVEDGEEGQSEIKDDEEESENEIEEPESEIQDEADSEIKDDEEDDESEIKDDKDVRSEFEDDEKVENEIDQTSNSNVQNKTYESSIQSSSIESDAIITIEADSMLNDNDEAESSKENNYSRSVVGENSDNETKEESNYFENSNLSAESDKSIDKSSDQTFKHSQGQNSRSYNVSIHEIESISSEENESEVENLFVSNSLDVSSIRITSTFNNSKRSNNSSKKLTTMIFPIANGIDESDNDELSFENLNKIHSVTDCVSNADQSSEFTDVIDHTQPTPNNSIDTGDSYDDEDDNNDTDNDNAPSMGAHSLINATYSINAAHSMNATYSINATSPMNVTSPMNATPSMNTDISNEYDKTIERQVVTPMFIKKMAKKKKVGFLNFKDSPKLVRPLDYELPENGLRRSTRTRVKPLQYWLGERPLYRPQVYNNEIDRPVLCSLIGVKKPSVIIPTKPIKKAVKRSAPKSNPKAAATFKDLLNLSIHYKKAIKVAKQQGESTNVADIVQSFRNYKWSPSKNSKDVLLAIIFNQGTTANGMLRFSPLALKKEAKSAGRITNFVVVHGTFLVNLISKEMKFVVSTGDHFMVNPGEEYSIRNCRQDEGVIAFNVVKCINKRDEPLQMDNKKAEEKKLSIGITGKVKLKNNNNIVQLDNFSPR